MTKLISKIIYILLGCADKMFRKWRHLGKELKINKLTLGELALNGKIASSSYLQSRL
jgi:hypothetical protein